VYSTIVEI
jgi:hypothetical protein